MPVYFAVRCGIVGFWPLRYVAYCSRAACPAAETDGLIGLIDLAGRPECPVLVGLLSSLIGSMQGVGVEKE
jgi:hypothetical protein